MRIVIKLYLQIILYHALLQIAILFYVHGRASAAIRRGCRLCSSCQKLISDLHLHSHALPLPPRFNLRQMLAVIAEKVACGVRQISLAGLEYRDKVFLRLILLIQRLQIFPQFRVSLFGVGKPDFHQLAVASNIDLQGFISFLRYQ